MSHDQREFGTSHLDELLKFGKSNKIKQEIHELIDNLDIEKASSDAKYVTYSHDKTTAISAVYVSAICTVDKIKTLLNACQKPKEKTLEEKLIDDDFKVIFESPNETVFLKKHVEVRICLPTNRYAIYSRLEAPNVLYGESNNHNLIFADIAYLESRIK